MLTVHRVVGSNKITYVRVRQLKKKKKNAVRVPSASQRTISVSHALKMDWIVAAWKTERRDDSTAPRVMQKRG